MLSNGAAVVCRVCHKQYAIYTCPRCNLRYCSLACYKGHSARCTESFMRENVLSEMSNISVSSESKRKMFEMLKRVHDAEADASGMNEDEDDPDREISISDLSPEELKDFQRAVASGELSHLIKPWEPWWLNPGASFISLNKQGNKLVTLVDENSSTDEVSDLPSPPTEPLPALSDISKAQPSPSLPLHLVELLYTYCFILRLYNGEWQASPLDAALEALSVSKVLSQAWSPESTFQAISSCVETICCSPTFKQAGGYNLALLVCRDVASLIRTGKGGLVCALADFKRLLEAALQEGKSGGCSKQNRSQLQTACRKLFFMTSWANEAAEAGAMLPLAGLVEAAQQKLIATRPESDEIRATSAAPSRSDEARATASAAPKRPAVLIEEVL